MKINTIALVTNFKIVNNDVIFQPYQHSFDINAYRRSASKSVLPANNTRHFSSPEGRRGHQPRTEDHPEPRHLGNSSRNEDAVHKTNLNSYLLNYSTSNDPAIRKTNLNSFY